MGLLAFGHLAFQSDIGLAPTRHDRFTDMSLSTKLFEYAAISFGQAIRKASSESGLGFEAPPRMRTLVTPRGGGMFVVDHRQTPMRIVAEYDKANVDENGCGEIQAGEHHHDPVSVGTELVIRSSTAPPPVIGS